MRLSLKQTKRAVSLLLCLALLATMIAFALSVSAEETEPSAAGVDNIADDSSNSDVGLGKKQSIELADTGASDQYVYCVNNAGWSTVTAYMWNSSSDANANWPGVAMTNIGNNFWRYKLPKAYANVIFSQNGQNQTVDLTYPGSNSVYDNAKGEWLTYDPDPSNTEPTSSVSTTATQAPTSASGAQYVYCENEAGWSNVTAYLWNSSTDNNAGWPGAAMTKIGDTVWRYQLPKTFKNIIFSQGGSNQTSDLTLPGAGYIYNNSTGKWDIYDTSPLQISFYGTDIEAPQYEGVGIVLNATAEGEGTVYYKFSVTSGSNTTVLSDYSTKNFVQWIPNAAGTYTLTYDFKDAKGNTNKRTKSFQVVSGLTSVSPYIKTVTPSGGEIKRNTAVNFSTSAGGGLTGTNLLFYKYTVRDSSGAIVNVPYYTLNRSYSFTPTALGAYTVKVSVQGSDNATVEREYSFNCVNTISPTDSPYIPTETQAPTQPVTQKPTTCTEPATQPPTQRPTQPATQAPTQAPEIHRGDADDDGDVTVIDATVIQRYLLGAPMLSAFNEDNADADADGDITIIDSTVIQRYLLGLYTL